MVKTLEPMTTGSISKRMIAFALPLLLGNLFQQLYNTVDSLIVGNFLGSSALAAVSSSGSLISMLIGFLSGIASGAGVIVSRYFGANDEKDVCRAVHTMVAFGLVAGVLMGVVVFLLAPQLVAAFDSNPEVIRFGVEKARTAALFYCLLAYSHSVASVLRGAGKAVVPMLIMMTFWCVVRVTFLSISIPMTHSIQMVYLVYPLTWSLSSIAFFFYYKKVNWMDLTDAGGAKQAG